MSTEEITRSTGSGNRDSWELAHPQRSVVIVYGARREGRAALRYAHALAAQADVPLTVLSIASRERTDIGCGSCRQGAAFRNELACEFATGRLTEARDLIVSEGPADVAVDFVLGRGSFVRAVLTAVGDHGADVIVLPARRRGRLRRAISRDPVKMLRGRTSASVIVAPDAADR
jgi:nucleotide-binding universal stress UspA family protein